MKKICIVGGGATGWMVACYLNKFVNHSQVTLVESSKVGVIGVGETVQVHVTRFLQEMEVNEHDMMKETGSIYKYGNNFIDWSENNEFFPFRWNLNFSDINQLLTNSQKNKDPFLSLKELHKTNLENYTSVQNNQDSLTNAWISLYLNNKIKGTFSESLSSHEYFSKNNKVPFIKELLFESDGLQHAYHINAEKFGDYLKRKVGINKGIVHKIGHVSDIKFEDNTNLIIDKLILDTGEEIESDLYIDCTGFHRVLINKLNRKWKHYTDMPADTAMVCQADYNNPEIDMVNYTKSICMSEGWAFDISLYHRKGTGYIFSSDLSDQSSVTDEYHQKLLSKFKPRFEPRTIRWEKKRLINPAEGNVVAIGMSSGFIEPMEANLLSIVVNATWSLVNSICKNPENIKRINWKEFNQTMADTYEDVADFILVHYTLSSKFDTPFWKEMQSLGQRKKHADLLFEKYYSNKNSFLGAASGHCIFPDYMWLQLAVGWGIDTTKWPKKHISEADLISIERFLENQKKLTVECLDQFTNNYQYHKSNIFNNIPFNEYENFLQ